MRKDALAWACMTLSLRLTPAREPLTFIAPILVSPPVHVLVLGLVLALLLVLVLMHIIMLLLLLVLVLSLVFVLEARLGQTRLDEARRVKAGRGETTQ